MGYRLPDKRCADHGRHIDDTARKTKISIDNGTVSHLLIPTFYHEHRHHDRKLHDHLGWPSPDHPDKSCQVVPWEEDLVVLDEIDLSGEGYDFVEFCVADDIDGLSATGSIDGNAVSLSITAMCPDAVKEDLDVAFSAYVVGEIRNDYDEPDVRLRDVIAKGILHIVAGPID